MDFPKNFKGRVIFSQNIEYGFISCMAFQDGEKRFLDEKNVYLGEIDVDIDFTTDARQDAVKVLQRQIEIASTEHQHALDIMNGKIQSLLAIEAPK